MIDPDLARRLTRHLAPVWGHYTNILAVRGEGAYLVADDGRRYLDFTCGIGVTNTGHCHPQVVAAAQEQMALLMHGQINIVYHEPVLRLVEALLPEMPAGLDTFFFANSGAEAIEAALKLARAATGREQVISFQGSFHGRTSGALSVTNSKARYRQHAGPLSGSAHVAPYPYCRRCSARGRLEGCCQRELQGLQELLATRVAPENVAAILVEPVLGEGGYVVPPGWFLPALRALCDQYGMLLIADEVQTGFARTGRMFAVEHTQTRPDIMVMAKGLGSGLPISAVAASSELMACWTTGSHGGTYGANAVACAAAAATLRVIKDEQLALNAERMGVLLRGELERLMARDPSLAEVRGLGLMLAAEFETPTGAPDGARAKAVMHACAQRGLLLLTCGPQDNVLRLIPPLVIGEAEVHQAAAILAASLEA
jgi:4-aminobutyrate aminotransferase